MIKIGKPPWTREEMTEKLEEFCRLYKKRPIQDNQGGMGITHMFYTWFALQKIKPKIIIESGVWLGQGTWFFERACPQAKIYCIEPEIDRINYRSDQAVYIQNDFSHIDWSNLSSEETLVFFDDHQNAYDRAITANWFGFKHLIFEDNYPPSHGDCYSLKKAFMNSGFDPSSTDNLKQKIKLLLGFSSSSHDEVPPNKAHEIYLRKNLNIYYEFPPIFKKNKTRWGDKWNYPTSEPLLNTAEKEYQKRFDREAKQYTWLCYVRLK